MSETAVKYEILDAHAHVYPEKVALKAATAVGDFYHMPMSGDGSLDLLFREEAEAGISRTLIHSVATTAKQVDAANRFIGGVVQASPDHFIGFGTLHYDSDDTERDILNAKAMGLKGIKLHPELQKFKVDSKWAESVYEILADIRMPVLLHTGDKRYDCSNPNRFAPMVIKYSKLIFIGAHFGGWSVYEEAAEKLTGLPNLYVDTTSTYYWTGKEGMERLIRAYGAEHVLFGTDYPMWKPKNTVSEILSLDLTDKERRMILSENAKKILNIG